MSGVMKSLFGGSDQQTTSQGTSASTSTSQQSQASAPVDVTPPAVSAFRDLVLGMAGQGLSGFLGNQPTYSGPLNAPMPGAATSMLSGLETLGAGAGGQLLRDTLGGRYLPGNSGFAPFQAAIDSSIASATRPVFQGLEETLSRTLPSRFIEAGQTLRGETPRNQGTSSAFDRAAAIATRGAADAAGSIASGIQGNAMNQAFQQQFQAIPLAYQEVSTMIENLKAQMLPQQIADQGVERGINQFNQQITQLLQALQMATGAGGLVNIGNVSAGQGTSDSSSFSQQTSEGSGDSQTGILPALGSFFSGVRGGGPRTA